MKILLIAAGSFAPWNVIGAIRWTKICKYLSQNGDEITVIAHKKRMTHSDELLAKDALLCKKVYYVSESGAEKILKIIFKLWGKTRGLSKEKSEKQFNALMMSQRYLRSISYHGFAKKAKQQINNLNEQYDIVISTNPLSAHWAAEYASKKLSIPWISDFRDPIAPTLPQSRHEKKLLQWQKRICVNSDSVIAVSKGLKEVLATGNEVCRDKIHVIYNGFDPDDRPAIKESSDGKLHLVYTGILYTGKRDLTPVFQALSELCRAGSILETDIVFDYAGNEIEILRDQARKYGMENIIKNHGFITRKESLALQMQSDILVMATYNDEGNPGVMPGKLYEYMMIRKPILAIVSGEVKGSELKVIIEKSSVGYCHETEFDGIDSLKEFLVMVRKNRDNGNEAPYLYDTRKFEYPQIASEVSRIISETIRDGKAR